MPLDAHAELVRADSEQDPIGLLIGQSTTRVPELVPVRYGRMLVSPFTFYRGAALIMADDLSRGPRTELTTQLCGDAHLSNFGVFASPERRLVFDLNDFDETHPGPFEWDVKRLAASLEIAGRNNGFSTKQRRGVVVTATRAYRTAVREFAAMSNLAVWYAHQAVQPGLPGLRAIRSKQSRRTVRRSLDKAYGRDHLGSLKSLTETVHGGLRFVSDPPLVVPARELDLPGVATDKLEEWMSRLLSEYARSLVRDRRHLIEQYTFVDIARKVVGVGSVGTRAWIVLLRGVDDQDPLILQAKEATSSVLEAYTAPTEFRSHGERVVEGQRMMQAYGDVLLGWHHSRRRVAPDYYLRQLRDWKGSLVVDTLDPEGLTAYAEYCAWTLARAHSRSGDRLAVAAYLGSKGTFEQAIAEFSAAYADKNEHDFGLLTEAAADGRIPVESGV
ncbi:DUF2252 domain-containing protein [Microlunatus ginsengisoli]|uniref:DUF2252 domain-containing protein n=1 Tax=Microlunatus ginsengisoli TaxID=363863 RepID=A0ABP7AE23_9ACTN